MELSIPDEGGFLLLHFVHESRCPLLVPVALDVMLFCCLLSSSYFKVEEEGCTNALDRVRLLQSALFDIIIPNSHTVIL